MQDDISKLIGTCYISFFEHPGSSQKHNYQNSKMRPNYNHHWGRYMGYHFLRQARFPSFLYRNIFDDFTSLCTSFFQRVKKFVTAFALVSVEKWWIYPGRMASISLCSSSSRRTNHGLLLLYRPLLDCALVFARVCIKEISHIYHWISQIHSLC